MGVSLFVGIFAAFLCHFQINNETTAKTTKTNDSPGKWGSHSFYCIFHAAPFKLVSLIALMCASKLGGTESEPWSGRMTVSALSHALQ